MHWLSKSPEVGLRLAGPVYSVEMTLGVGMDWIVRAPSQGALAMMAALEILGGLSSSYSLYSTVGLKLTWRGGLCDAAAFLCCLTLWSLAMYWNMWYGWASILASRKNVSCRYFQAFGVTVEDASGAPSPLRSSICLAPVWLVIEGTVVIVVDELLAPVSFPLEDRVSFIAVVWLVAERSLFVAFDVAFFVISGHIHLIDSSSANATVACGVFAFIERMSKSIFLVNSIRSPCVSPCRNSNGMGCKARIIFPLL